jgi:hypothetical protein
MFGHVNVSENVNRRELLSPLHNVKGLMAGPKFFQQKMLFV